MNPTALIDMIDTPKTTNEMTALMTKAKMVSSVRCEVCVSLAVEVCSDPSSQLPLLSKQTH